MTAALLLEIAGYVVQYGPQGYKVVSDLINGVRDLQKDGNVPTNEQLQALASRIHQNHLDLPVPK